MARHIVTAPALLDVSRSSIGQMCIRSGRRAGAAKEVAMKNQRIRLRYREIAAALALTVASAAFIAVTIMSKSSRPDSASVIAADHPKPGQSAR
ncbi:MAG: hypothetical protein R3D31_10300 [Hyphomicrobiaceae bacterium]